MIIISLRNTFNFIVIDLILTTCLLLLTASIYHILPRFAYSVIVLTISAAATYPANRGKTGQTNENQEDFKI